MNDLEVQRCAWATGGTRPDPLMVAYHDDEWGVPVSGDAELFERLSLECFQAGLSWATILRKRKQFRVAFQGFDPAVVARFDLADRDRLMANRGIVRNGLKIDSTITNALAFQRVVAQFGSFDAYLRTMAPPLAPPWPAGTGLSDLPSRSPASDALSADLKARGFRFVGSTIVYAFMESVGLVDDHLPGCFRYRG